MFTLPFPRRARLFDEALPRLLFIEYRADYDAFVATTGRIPTPKEAKALLEVLQ